MNHDLENAIELFPWQSEEQKKGYLSLLSYEKELGLQHEAYVNPQIAFVIQKNHEAAEYWRDTTSTQVMKMENIAVDLAKKLEHAIREIDLLATAHKSQVVAFEEIRRAAGALRSP